jgi:hypothetical protein
MISILKKVTAVILLLPGYCFSQNLETSAHTLQITAPAVLKMSSPQSEIIKWTQQQGGTAKPDTYAIEFISIGVYGKNCPIVGLAVGGFYSPVHSSSIATGYIDLIMGARVYSDKFLQINTLGHLDYLTYTIDGISPPNNTVPLHDEFYRARTVGAGLSLQIQFKLMKFKKFDVLAGVEPGVFFIADHPNWQYGYYYYYASNGGSGYSSHHPFKGIDVNGPDIAGQLKYVRFSLAVRI